MLTTFFDFEWDYWNTIKKCTFDGDRKLIIVNEGVTELDIRVDVYSRWIDWRDLAGNMAYEEAMRFTGLDPIPGGQTGDSYFLTNGWKLVYDPRLVKVTGVLYSDDYDTPYYFTDGSAIYPATVAALVNTVTTTQNVVTGDLGSLSIPTAAENALAVWLSTEGAQVIADIVAAKLAAQAAQTASESADTKIDDIPTNVWNHTQ